MHSRAGPPQHSHTFPCKQAYAGAKNNGEFEMVIDEEGCDLVDDVMRLWGTDRKDQLINY